jgi:hypothetical protein
MTAALTCCPSPCQVASDIYLHHMPVKQRISSLERPPLHISPKLLGSCCCRCSLNCRLLLPLQLLLLPLTLELRLLLSRSGSTIRSLTT